MAGANWADIAFDIHGKRCLGNFSHNGVAVGFAKHSILLKSEDQDLLSHLVSSGEMNLKDVHVLANETLSREGVVACVWAGPIDEPILGFAGITCYGFDHNNSFGIPPSILAQFWYQILDWVEDYRIPECFGKIDLTQASADPDISDSFRKMLGVEKSVLISSVIPNLDLEVLLEEIPTLEGYDRTKLDKLIARVKKLI